VGTLSYGYPVHICSIDDRTLVHLQIVIIHKLRLGEAFCFSCVSGGRPTTLWLSPGIPLLFEISEPTGIAVNRAWLLALERSAQSVQGLRVVDEPLPPSPGATVRPVTEGMHAVPA